LQPTVTEIFANLKEHNVIMDQTVFAPSNQARFALIIEKLLVSPKLLQAMIDDYRVNGQKSKWNLNSVWEQLY
jgi:hypothetical protein